MNVVVTGAGGFVGRNLIDRLLVRGNTVTAVDIEGNTVLPTFHHERLRTVFMKKGEKPGRLLEYLTGKSFDTMIHLAWVGAGGPLRRDYTVQLNNVKMTLDFFMTADALGCKKFVAVGTIGEYMAEMAKRNQIHSDNFMYATCKSMTHSLLNIVEHDVGCKVVWATLGGLYGVGDSTNNLVNYTIKSLLSNTKPIFGPAEQPFDFVNIKDCANALCLIAETNTCANQFYVGTGKPRLLKEYLTEIARLVDNGINVGIGGRPDDGTRYLYEWFDISELEKETGYKPAYTFETGVAEILKDLR